MKYVIDTDHITILPRRGGSDYGIVAMNISQHGVNDIGFSIVSFHEQARGCHNLINNPRSEADVLFGYELLAGIIEDYRRFPLLFDAAALRVFDQLRSSKVRIGTMDLRIASIALAYNLTVVTRNSRDFGLVSGLRIEDWTR